MLTQIMKYSDPFMRLKRSRFRRSFHLSRFEKEKAREKGLEQLGIDAFEIIRKRLSSPEKSGYVDGRQTPFHGIIFKAQHATATCCRNCMLKWHEVPRHRELDEKEIKYTLWLILSWIAKELKRQSDSF